MKFVGAVVFVSAACASEEAALLLQQHRGGAMDEGLGDMCKMVTESANPKLNSCRKACGMTEASQVLKIAANHTKRIAKNKYDKFLAEAADYLDETDPEGSFCWQVTHCIQALEWAHVETQSDQVSIVNKLCQPKLEVREAGHTFMNDFCSTNCNGSGKMKNGKYNCDTIDPAFVPTTMINHEEAAARQMGFCQYCKANTPLGCVARSQVVVDGLCTRSRPGAWANDMEPLNHYWCEKNCKVKQIVKGAQRTKGNAATTCEPKTDAAAEEDCREYCSGHKYKQDDGYPGLREVGANCRRNGHANNLCTFLHQADRLE